MVTRVLTGIGIGTLLVICLAAHGNHPRLVGLWGVVIAFSLFGWGALVERLVGGDRTAGFGLRAAWGMAAYLIFGGVLVLLHLARAPVLVVFIALGCAQGAWAVRTAPSGPRPDWVSMTVALGVCIPFLSSIFDQSDWYRYDDAPAYFAFVKQTLAIGTIDQPMSLRALQGFGGQTLLHALTVLPDASYLAHIHLFDKGICSLIVVAQLLERPRSRGRIASALAIAFFLSLRSPRENSASACSGTVLFLALDDAVTRVLEDRRLTRHAAFLVALSSAGLAALRPNYIPVVAVIITIVAIDCLRNRLDREQLIAWLRLGGLILVMLAPWMLRSAIVFATPLYPLMRGNAHPQAFGMRDHFESKIEALKMGLAVTHRMWGYCLGPALLFAGVLAAKSGGPRTRTAMVFSVATLVGIAAQMIAMPAMPDESHMRYAFAYLAATVVIVVVRSEGTLAWPIAAAAVVAHFALREDTIGQDVQWQINEIAAPRPSDVLLPDVYARYERLQSKLDRGARVVAAVDEPYRFDFARNTIWTIDFPGSVAPRSYEWWTGDADMLRRYFVVLGVRYLVVADFDSSNAFFSRSKQIQNKHHMWEIQRDQAPLFLRFMDQIDQLVHKCKVVAREPGLVAIEL